MRAVEAMIVWTPNREPFKELPTVGTIAVTTIPEAPELKTHPMSVGACDLIWRETDDSGRRELMQWYFTDLIHRDFLKEKVVRKALSAIEDFARYPFSAAKPDPNDDN